MKFPDNSQDRVTSAIGSKGSGSACAASEKAARRGALGIKRQFVDIADAKGRGREAPDRPAQTKAGRPQLTPEQQAERRKLQLRDRMADQREAARLMWKNNLDGRPGGVTFCGWTIQAMAESIEVVRVTKPDSAPRSFLKGVSRCGLGWVCPVCTAAKAEIARQKINAVLSKGRRVGWKMVMITLTVQHDEYMPLEWLWDRLSAASDELRTTYPWKRLNKALVGSVKAVEATHGANGWHLHYHIILVFKADAVLDQAEAEAMAETLRSEWMTQIRSQGLNGNERAFQVQGAASAGNYLAKWGLSEELTLGHAKRGRKGQRSPWQLLRDSREGDPEAGRLWHAFVTAIKGTHQLRINPTLNAEVKSELARLKEAKAEAIAAGKIKDEPENHIEMASFDAGDDEWKETGRHRRIRMLEGAAARTRREAERAVWKARHGAETDASLFEVQLIEDDEKPAAPVPHDQPEKRVAELRAIKNQQRRDKQREFSAVWDALDDDRQFEAKPKNVDNLSISIATSPSDTVT